MRKTPLGSILLGLILLLSPITEAIASPAPAQCDTVYAVHDQGVQDSQFFRYRLTAQTLEILGVLHQTADIEGLAVHPDTHLLYASSGQPNAKLYTVDAQTGALALVGEIGFDDVVGLAFHPDGSLWGWSKPGLIEIDVNTGAGTLVLAGDYPIYALTWNKSGTALYGTAKDTPDSSTLWVWTDGNTQWEIACSNLPKKVEGLETMPDGLFVYGFHNDNQLAIHSFDVSACQTVTDGRIDTPYNDIEGIAWPNRVCPSENLAALRAYLESLDGVSAVDITASGTISVTQNGQTYYSQLDNSSLVAGTPPSDGKLILTQIPDDNCDGIDDSKVTYPSGDQQIIHHFGTQMPAPVPTLVVPEIDPTVASLLDTTTAFLYSGDNPIQTGVASGTINPVRAAAVRGKITACQGKPLSGVTLTVLNHPEYGQTQSRADGQFDLAVNGGGALTIRYQKAGFLPVQRTLNVPWQEYTVIDDVELIRPDNQVSHIDLNADVPIQVAQGSEVTDEDGTRRVTILFPQGTTATMVMPDGSTQPLTTLSVRATEYTVGERGPQSMPAELPPSTDYTYAVELSVDQAVAAGANHVEFNQPVPVYVDNFIDFPVGVTVPSGWYSPNQAAWVASTSGKVIGIVEINQGLAILDVEGQGEPATEAALLALGITEVEQRQLALLYPEPGKSVWRVPVSHFTVYDFNWILEGPENNKTPKPDPKNNEPPPDQPDCKPGSIIECQSQTLGETLPIAGTNFTLNYRSSRTEGQKVARTLVIPISGDDEVNGYRALIVEIQVAGRQFIKRFEPGAPAHDYHFTWDGKDAFGRTLQGEQRVKLRLGYEYQGHYRASFSGGGWGRSSNGGFVSRTGRTDSLVTNWSNWYTTQLGTLFDARGQGLGGWTLNAQHTYSPIGKGLALGDGRKRQNTPILSGAMTTVLQDNAFRGGIIATGPDGRVYVASGNTVKRLGPDGHYTEVANGFSNISDLKVDKDSNVYLVDNGRFVKRISKDGTVTLIAGGGTKTYQEGLLATEVNFYQAQDYWSKRLYSLAIGSDGHIYVSDRYNGWSSSSTTRIYRIDPQGIVTTFLGNSLGDVVLNMVFARDENLYIHRGYSSSHSVAATTRISRLSLSDGTIEQIDWGKSVHTTGYNSSIQALDTDADGNLYYIKTVPDVGHVLYRRTDDGQKITLAGGGNRTDDGSSATGARISPYRSHSLAIAPDAIYIGGYKQIRKIGPVFPGVVSSDINIASQDGSLIYHFSREGRHLSTVDALTGVVVYQFSYDNNGYVSAIIDRDGDVTRIERDVNSLPKAIVAPDGQRTHLVLNAQGYLTRLVTPAGERYRLAYTEEGLLTGFTTARGHRTEMVYDELGRLIYEENPAGGSWSLERSREDSRYEVSLTSALGRTTGYAVESANDKDVRRVNISPSGLITETEMLSNGTTTQKLPDGTVIKQKSGPDPRFGMLSPVVENLTILMPSGLEASVKEARQFVAGEQISTPESVTYTTTINGIRTSQSVYERASKTVTSTSAAGRQSVSFFDDKGRVVKEQVPGLANVYYRYDSRGRLNQVIEGENEEARTTVIGYDPESGYVAKITDALQRSEEYTRDAVGRVLTQKLPDNRKIAYEYDQNGNLTALKPPSRPEHGFDYTEVDLQQQYTPPVLGEVSEPQTQYAYNLDKQLVQISRPDGIVIDLVYDEVNGRLNRIDLPNEASVNYAYSENTGKLETITASDGSTLSYTYDGFLRLSETWGNGDVAGTLGFSYDNNFRVTSISVNGNAVNYQYDVDSLLIKAGDLSLTRHAQNGLLTATQLGSLATERAHNVFGEMATETASYDGSTLYRTEYSRDQLGRITQQAETFEGMTTTVDYRYDVAGRLVEVKQDDSVVEAYTYDGNGNRLSALTENGLVVGRYDDQDRLVEYGSTTYEYTANGELRRKENSGEATEYRYDVLGNLRFVLLPDGTKIEYVIDGRNRRVGKKVNGVLAQGFLYQDSLNPVAELDGDGNVVSLFVYGSKANVPDYMVKGGNTYRVLSDHLGSPRLVVDINDGSVAQRMDYDTFGNVIEDSNPGFQPFGFAGGVYDLDTKLTRFGARDYDAEMGRWTAKDPILFAGGDTNLFGYVVNDPVNLIDPEGLESFGSCVRQNRFDLEASLGTLVGAGVGALHPKTESEYRRGGGSNSPNLSKNTTRASRLGLKLRKKFGKKMKIPSAGLRGLGRIATFVALPLLVGEGFYDVTTIVRCACVSDSI